MPFPTPADDGRQGGKISGQSRRITAVQGRIDDLVNQAGDLTDGQVVRLRGILRNGAARLDDLDRAVAGEQ